MAGIDKNHQPPHPALRKWAHVTAQIRTFINERQVHPSKVVVVVPFAQLIHELRAAWLAGVPPDAVGFTPQFQSTMNWAQCLGATVAQPEDLQMNPGLDALNASLWVARVGLSAHAPMLVPLLLEAARSLAPVAASVDPLVRVDWSERLASQLFGVVAPETFAFETAVAQLALTWVGHSVFPTDILFDSAPALFVLIKGFQDDPLAQALAGRWADRCLQIALHEANSGQLQIQSAGIALHASLDAQDEAERACACVLRHLTDGRQPVGLIAVDRLLTRRVHALLNSQGVVIRDETGWKLSTTRAAAAVVGLLKACAPRPGSDEVLDWLKNAPAFDGAAVQVTEAYLRRQGIGQWPLVLAETPSVQGMPDPVFGLVQSVNSLRATLVQVQGLNAWLEGLQHALQVAGQWQVMAADEAGKAVNKVLMLDQHLGAQRESPALAVAMRFTEFAHWVNQTLEAANFMPLHPPDAQVIILPLSQLLGRPLQAVVLAGCDEARLPVTPVATGPWTTPQRETIGLALPGDLASAQRAAWHYALETPRLDVLWRNSEAGEPVLPNGYVQELCLHPDFLNAGFAADPRVTRLLLSTPLVRAKVQAAALPVPRLSATAYNDLRQCPYRFFALRQLGLATAEELDGGVDKRDFGNWLHRVLFHFHTANAVLASADTEPAMELWTQKMDAAAALATRESGLSEAEFLPFSASWPQVRQGYLKWLAQPQNWFFSEGEVWRELQLGPVKLVGKLDRVDRLPNGAMVLLDYKTEPQTTTRKRIKQGPEDTQLPFYAALFDEQAVQGAYLNVSEREGTVAFVQPELVALREQLAEGILEDMQRLADGHWLVAMGQGSACDYCAARGLCRKDMAAQA